MRSGFLARTRALGEPSSRSSLRGVAWLPRRRLDARPTFSCPSFEEVDFLSCNLRGPFGRMVAGSCVVWPAIAKSYGRTWERRALAVLLTTGFWPEIWLLRVLGVVVAIELLR